MLNSITRVHENITHSMTQICANMLKYSPGLCDNLWCYICGCSTDSVQGSVYHGGQAKVTQLQRFASVLMLVHLWIKAKNDIRAGSKINLDPSKQSLKMTYPALKNPKVSKCADQCQKYALASNKQIFVHVMSLT